MCWRRTLGFLVMPLPFAAVPPPCALAPADFLICRHETAAQRQRKRLVATGGTPTQPVVTVAVAAAVATGVVATGRPRRVMVARMVAMELAAMGSGRTVESVVVTASVVGTEQRTAPLDVASSVSVLTKDADLDSYIKGRATADAAAEAPAAAAAPATE